MKFEVIGRISGRETIARGGGIRDLERIQRDFGRGAWRKCKGRAKVRFADGRIVDAEVHWYEAHGVGRREVKVKRTIK